MRDAQPADEGREFIQPRPSRFGGRAGDAGLTDGGASKGSYLRMVTALQIRTTQDLAALGLSEPEYEVLSTLSERRDGTSTLHDQATKMGWSRSRLPRHAFHMEARELIRRAPDPTDGRGCLM